MPYIELYYKNKIKNKKLTFHKKLFLFKMSIVSSDITVLKYYLYIEELSINCHCKI